VDKQPVANNFACAQTLFLGFGQGSGLEVQLGSADALQADRDMPVLDHRFALPPCYHTPIIEHMRRPKRHGFILPEPVRA
jgi:hypothetical protein